MVLKDYINLLEKEGAVALPETLSNFMPELLALGVPTVDGSVMTLQGRSFDIHEALKWGELSSGLEKFIKTF